MTQISFLTSIGGGGRIVIPAEIRRALGVKQGDELTLLLEGGEVRMLTRAQAVREAQAVVRRRVRPGRSLSDELIAERRAEASDA